MINLFFVVHDYSGARTYADEILGYVEGQKGIKVHKIYMESCYYNEYTERKEGNTISIHIPKVKRNGNSLGKYSSRCIDLMIRILNGKQNLIFHLNLNTHVELGLEARNRFGAYIIYTVHFLPNYFSYLATLSQMPDNFITIGDELEKQVIKEADQIICVTCFAKESMLKWYNAPENKITIIHNGIGFEYQHQLFPLRKKVQIKKRLGFTKEEQIILFVGKLEKRKGINHLVTVFNKLSTELHNIRLVIVGDGDFKEAFNYANGCWSKITLTGKISKEELIQLYQIADIGVISSIYEQCSYVALEMMQYGLPVVVTAAPGLKELYNNKKNAIIAPLVRSDNTLMELEVIEEELEKSIKILLNDEKMRKEIRESTMNNWKTNYTSIHMGKATIKVYDLLQKNEFRHSKYYNIPTR